MSKRSIFCLAEPVMIIAKQFPFNGITIENGSICHRSFVTLSHSNELLRCDGAIRICEPCGNLLILYSQWNKEFGDALSMGRSQGSMNMSERFSHAFNVDQAFDPLYLLFYRRRRLHIFILRKSGLQVNISMIRCSSSNFSKIF